MNMVDRYIRDFENGLGEQMDDMRLNHIDNELSMSNLEAEVENRYQDVARKIEAAMHRLRGHIV